MADMFQINGTPQWYVFSRGMRAGVLAGSTLFFYSLCLRMRTADQLQLSGTARRLGKTEGVPILVGIVAVVLLISGLLFSCYAIVFYRLATSSQPEPEQEPQPAVEAYVEGHQSRAAAAAAPSEDPASRAAVFSNERNSQSKEARIASLQEPGKASSSSWTADGGSDRGFSPEASINRARGQSPGHELFEIQATLEPRENVGGSRGIDICIAKSIKL
jgi:hypothetical protein